MKNGNGWKNKNAKHSKMPLATHISWVCRGHCQIRVIITLMTLKHLSCAALQMKSNPITNNSHMDTRVWF